jgi:hypothetical protein
VNILFLASLGVMSSFVNSLMKSARGCSMPPGPATIGPTRFCMRASNLRSTQSQNKVNSTIKAKPGNMRICKINQMSIIFYHRSVHEKQGSKLTKLAGTSAMLSPIAVLRNDGMLAKVGVLIFTRSGMSVPLLFT